MFIGRQSRNVQGGVTGQDDAGYWMSSSLLETLAVGKTGQCTFCNKTNKQEHPPPPPPDPILTLNEASFHSIPFKPTAT